MVEIKGLNKFYGKFIALNNLDLHIDKGELFGFVGPNGAGKTTTMKILSGLLKASGGEVYDCRDRCDPPKYRTQSDDWLYAGFLWCI